jgi:hypothetical protein
MFDRGNDRRSYAHAGRTLLYQSDDPSFDSVKIAICVSEPTSGSAGPAGGRCSQSFARVHGLNAIRELYQGWIRQDFGPTLEIELGLRNPLRELNGDRHRQKYARNEKLKPDRGKRQLSGRSIGEVIRAVPDAPTFSATRCRKRSLSGKRFFKRLKIGTRRM